MALDSKGLEALMSDFNKKFGSHAVELGTWKPSAPVISTGVLELDYKLGTGGWTLGQLHEIYGAPDLGKSSSLGLAAIREAQKAGYTAAIIAVEPNFDPAWAFKHNVDPERLLIARPNTGEEAFAMAIEIVDSGSVDLVLFDSVGAVISASEMEADGVAKMGGQSGLITRGVKAIAPKAYRNNCAVLLINQIRDNMRATVSGVVESPGGHALKHACATRTLLRPTKNVYKAKIDGDDVVIGREIAAIIQRNKLSEGTGRRALFNFFQMEVEGYPFGIDEFTDVINTAVSTGVIEKAASYFGLPGHEKRIQGFDKVKDYLAKNPDEVASIRKSVLATLGA